jgi:hypothetical protein
MDIINASFNGKLKEKVYMRQPLGFEVLGQEDLVCLLHSSLYRLKQSLHEW